jgi:predicted nucleotidyltransferase
MVTLDTLQHEKRDAILQLAGEYGARDIRVFGSVARGESSGGSDVDFLVEFESGRTLFDLIRLRLALRDLLGTEVDLVTPGSLHYLRDRVLSEAKPI